MTGVIVTIDISEEQLRASLDGMVGRMENTLGFYSNVRDYWAAATRDRFESEVSPEGVPWAKLRPSTVKSRVRKRQSPTGILRATGVLNNSINATATADRVSIGSPEPYAAIHQLGGTISREARSQTIYRKLNKKTGAFEPLFRKKKLKTSVPQEVAVPAHEITIPARPYLGISAEDRTRIAEIAREWLLGE